MTTHFREVILLCLAGLALALASPCSAQYSGLDNLGKQFAKQLRAQKAVLPAVSDLVPADGAVASQGHFFAQFLTYSLEHYGKNLIISEHQDFDAELGAAHITAANFASPGATAALSGKVKEDVILSGVVTRDQKDYTLEMSAVHVSDGKILYASTATVERSEFLDSFAEHFPPEVGQKVYSTSGPEKVRVPECVECPAPPIEDLARRDKVKGKSIFKVLVSPEGRAVSLYPVRLAGCGMDEEAFETIKKWRFRPAEDSAGNPVFVVVPIEVTFQLN